MASDKLWESFCHAISRPDLLDDQRYRSNRLRVEHRGELEPLLEEMFRGQTAAHWVEVLGRAGIPCSPVRNLREVVEDEHVQARDMLPEVEHPTAGRIRVTGAPVKLSQSHAGVPTAARRLGEDSTAVLSEFLRMDQQEIERLRQAGVIA